MRKTARVVIAKAVDTFDAFGIHTGRAHDASYFNIIDEDADVYGEEADGTRILLAKYRKNVFSPALQDLARECFEGAAKKAKTWRKNALGPANANAKAVEKKRKASHSLLAGYWDRRDMSITRVVKAAFPAMKPMPNTICRPTTFTRDYPELWARGMPWLKAIAKAHRALAPAAYKRQLEAANAVLPLFRVTGTPFTTITVNANWRTNTHVDSGDFEQGLGNLAVTGSRGDWRGGALGFPRFKVAVAMMPGDFAVMRVHEWHCNTAIHLDTSAATRLTFVCYLRENMSLCQSTVTLPDGTLVGVPGK